MIESKILMMIAKPTVVMDVTQLKVQYRVSSGRAICLLVIGTGGSWTDGCEFLLEVAAGGARFAVHHHCELGWDWNMKKRPCFALFAPWCRRSRGGCGFPGPLARRH